MIHELEKVLILTSFNLTFSSSLIVPPCLAFASSESCLREKPIVVVSERNVSSFNSVANPRHDDTVKSSLSLCVCVCVCAIPCEATMHVLAHVLFSTASG